MNVHRFGSHQHLKQLTYELWVLEERADMDEDVLRRVMEEPRVAPAALRCHNDRDRVPRTPKGTRTRAQRMSTFGCARDCSGRCGLMTALSEEGMLAKSLLG